LSRGEAATFVRSASPRRGYASGTANKIGVKRLAGSGAS
jgi:hypothetical protein